MVRKEENQENRVGKGIVTFFFEVADTLGDYNGKTTVHSHLSDLGDGPSKDRVDDLGATCRSTRTHHCFVFLGFSPQRGRDDRECLSFL